MGTQYDALTGSRFAYANRRSVRRGCRYSLLQVFVLQSIGTVVAVELCGTAWTRARNRLRHSVSRGTTVVSIFTTAHAPEVMVHIKIFVDKYKIYIKTLGTYNCIRYTLRAYSTPPDFLKLDALSIWFHDVYIIVVKSLQYA